MDRKPGCTGWTHEVLKQKRSCVRQAASVTMMALLLLLGVVSCASGVSAGGAGAAAASVESGDVACLREFKESVTDPLGYLRNWDFRGKDLNICSFIGVRCIRPDEPKVVGVDLTAAGLRGRISPDFFRKCSSLRDLNLSNNFFTGRVPPTICVHNHNLVTLDFSNNNLREPAPPSLQRCLESHRQHSNSQPSEDIFDDAVIEMFSAAGREKSAQ